MSHHKPALLLGLGLGLLAGCAPDPFAAPPSWNFTGANGANLAAMVADPMDLVRGRSDGGGASGQLAAAAVARLRRGQLKELPTMDTTGGQVGSNSLGTAGGGSAAAAPEAQ
jgi:type IV pilus biogenesis protein CpaD/CtpE